MDNIFAAWNYIKLWWVTERNVSELFFERNKTTKVVKVVKEEQVDEYDEVVKYAGGCPNYNRQGK